MSITNQFNKAVSIAQSLSSIEAIKSEKLIFYGIFKQATEGDNQLLKPSSKQINEYGKWKAWNQLKGVDSVEAKKIYIKLLIKTLTEFIEIYPNHEHYSYIKSSIDSLKHSKNEHIKPLSLPKHHHRHLSSISNSYYPLTPITSPGYSMTDQWVKAQQEHIDDLSESDTLDNEVAAITSKMSIKREDKKEKLIEKLQLEIFKLSKEIQYVKKKLENKKTNKISDFIQLFINHVFTNSILFTVVFLILLKRKSPIAYTILGYIKSNLLQHTSILKTLII